MNQLYIIFDRNHVYFAFNMFVHTIFRSVARSSLPHFVCPSVRLSVRLSLTVMFFLHISYITQLGKVPTPNIMCGHMLEGRGLKIVQNIRGVQTIHRQEIEKTQTRHRQDIEKTQTSHRQDINKTQTRHRQDIDKIQTRHRQDIDKTQTRHR